MSKNKLNRRFRRCRLLANLLPAVLTNLCGIAAIADDNEIIETIKDCWRGRAHVIAGIHCQWKEDVTVEAGYFATGNDPELKTSTPQPPDGASYSREVTLRWDPDSVRIDIDGAEWDTRGQRFVRVAYTRCQHENDETFFQSTGATDYPYASIDKRREKTVANSVEFSPVFFVVAPFDETVSPVGKVSQRDWVVRAARENVGTAPCVVVDFPSNGQFNLQRTVWLDPTKDFNVVRWEGTRIDSSGQRRTVTHVDIEYEWHAMIKWSPSKWSISSRPGFSSPGVHTSAAVTSFIVNPTLDTDTFKIDFSPGTWVQNDDRIGYPWLLLHNGDRARILPHERKLPYHKLVETVTRRNSQRVLGLDYHWWWVVTLIGLLSVILVLWWRSTKGTERAN